MAKQQLTLENLEGGDVLALVNRAMLEIQDATLGKKTKGSLTLKLNFDTTKSDSICAVTAEISKSVPKTKFGSLYNKGAQYLVADPVPVTRGVQDELPGVNPSNVVELNRAQA
jgi:hypothetical protein